MLALMRMRYICETDPTMSKCILGLMKKMKKEDEPESVSSALSTLVNAICWTSKDMMFTLVRVLLTGKDEANTSKKQDTSGRSLRRPQRPSVSHKNRSDRPPSSWYRGENARQRCSMGLRPECYSRVKWCLVDWRCHSSALGCGRRLSRCSAYSAVGPYCTVDAAR
jgi:hypothetical protein